MRAGRLGAVAPSLALILGGALSLWSAQGFAYNQTQTCDRTGASSFVCGQSEAPKGVHWARRCVNYNIHKAGAPEVPLQSGQLDPTLRETIHTSFQTWNDVSCSNMVFVPSDDTTDTYIGYEQARGSGNLNILIWQQQWAHTRSAYALTSVTFDVATGQIADADIEFNSQHHTFTISDSNPDVDIQNTLTHEVGHFLGLDHVANNEATMYESAQGGELIKRTLHADDEAGICALYPVGSGRLSCKTDLPFSNSTSDAAFGSPGYPPEGCRHSSYPSTASDLPLCANDEGIPANQEPDDDSCLCGATGAPDAPAPLGLLGLLGLLGIRRRARRTPHP